MVLYCTFINILGSPENPEEILNGETEAKAQEANGEINKEAASKEG